MSKLSLRPLGFDRIFVAMIAVIMVMPLCVAWAAKGDLQATEVEMAVEGPTQITLGKAQLLKVDGDVSDVLVADPRVIDVAAVQSNSLYVVGLTVGDTNIIVLDGEGNILEDIHIHVTYDLKAIQALVNQLFPGEEITVGSIHDQILLTGEVSNPGVASKVTQIVGHYVSDLQDIDGRPIDEIIANLLEVRGEQQVMMQVKIVEASRSVFKEFGISTDFNDPNEAAASTIFGTTRPTTTIGGDGSATLDSGAALTQPSLATLRLLADTGINGIGDIGVFLDALEERNLANVLAEPNLTSISGEQAGFLAGGEFPVPSGLDNVGNVIVTFREFGVSLNFRPTVLSEERISLQLNTEVSAVDNENAVTLGGIVVPGRSIRRASTTVEVPTGGSLMIAGILQSNAIEGYSGLPGIAQTPVLGDLVKSDNFMRDETELVVIVTPYLVEPYKEVEMAQHVPKDNSNPLAQAFVANIRRTYEVEDESLFEAGAGFGYLLD
ncbi:MAG: type II and III secretion system protein family protein [Alphaproteobacteria bacterium]|nr:type II and III secretion system protein family protein [Alphaproteobacteria bacterium]